MKNSKDYIFPDIRCMKAVCITSPLQEGGILEHEFHIQLSTNIRKECEGKYYLIPVLKKSVWKSAGDYTKAYEEFIKECYKIQLFYRLPDSHIDSWGNQVVIEDKNSKTEQQRVKELYLLQ